MNDKKIKKRVEQTQGILCSKLAIETLEQGVKYVQSYWNRSGVFIGNFEHDPHLVLVFLLLTLGKEMPAVISRSQGDRNIILQKVSKWKN